MQAIIKTTHPAAKLSEPSFTVDKQLLPAVLQAELE